MTDKIKSDGSTASYYELPAGARELQDLIAYKNMNGQMAEIFRAGYRYGQVEHSDKLRDINKILFYAQAEKERLLKYEQAALHAQTDASENSTAERMRELQEAKGKNEGNGTAKNKSSRKKDSESCKVEYKELETAAEEELERKLYNRPACTICDAEIEGRVFYLGNEPRCAKHSG